LLTVYPVTHRMDGPRVRKHRDELNAKLTEVEGAIELFSRETVYIAE
jgi:hypothetical protein